MLHQPFLVGLEGFVLLGFGGDQGVKAAQARGDALLFEDAGVRDGNAIQHRLVELWLGHPRDEVVELDGVEIHLHQLLRAGGLESQHVGVIVDPCAPARRGRGCRRGTHI